MKALFTAGARGAFELESADVPAMQRFFEANPEYFVNVNGEAPRPNEALEEFESAPPPDWKCGKRWVIGFFDEQGTMVGMTHVVADMLADTVWHVGFFVLATHLHGQGTARLLYEQLEQWMLTQGARWSRLGVVEGNQRGEKFWERVGYVETRKRHDMPTGKRISTLRVMAKPLGHATSDDYLALVPRDRPDSP